MTDRADRAEEARRKILASGDQDLINRLYLMEAAQAQPQPQPQTPAGSGASLLGMGLAVGGGVWLGSLLAGMTLSREMQEAFATVASDLGIDGAEDLAAGTLTEASAEGEGLLDDLGLGDLGGFFDI